MRAAISATAAALMALCSVACSTRASTEDPFEVLELSQGAFTGGDFPLQYERSDETRVLELRVREKLDAVVAGSKGEIELFKKLTSWARSQFEPGDPNPYPLCNGISILDDVRAGKTGGFCAQYAYLLGDALKSFGHFTVRYVELESESGSGHFAVEVWSNDLNRWLLLDPLHAALYDLDGLPISAVEIHDALLSGRSAAVHVNRLPFTRGSSSSSRKGSSGTRPHASLGAPAQTAPGGPSDPSGGDASGAGPGSATDTTRDDELLSVFYNVAVSTRNDFARLERPLSLADRERLFLRYVDPRTRPFQQLSFSLASVRRADFLAPMNQVAIDLSPDPHKGVLHVSFSTRGTCPHFARYRVRIGEGPWKDWGPLLAWSVAHGDNHLEVRTVNAFEVLGPVFRIRVRA